MNYSLNVKSSSIVHTLLSNCVKLLGKVQKLLIKCISYSVISKRIRVVSPKFYTARKNFTGPPVPTVPTNFKSVCQNLKICLLCQVLLLSILSIRSLKETGVRATRKTRNIIPWGYHNCIRILVCNLYLVCSSYQTGL